MHTASQYCKYELKGSFPNSHKPTFQAGKSDSKGGEESLIS
jgi:hypothetical protein